MQGCRDISVGYQNITEQPAHVTHVLQDADLALLQVDGGGAEVTPLVETDRGGDVNEVLNVYGYALGQATRENRRLIVTAANEGGASLSVLRVRMEVRGRSGLPILFTRDKRSKRST